MAVISKGIALFRNETELENLQDIPELGGSKEAIEITPDIAKKMTKAQICEMKEEMPVVNMTYLRELVLKYSIFKSS